MGKGSIFGAFLKFFVWRVCGDYVAGVAFNSIGFSKISQLGKDKPRCRIVRLLTDQIKTSDYIRLCQADGYNQGSKRTTTQIQRMWL
jgi:hypothetical protein